MDGTNQADSVLHGAGTDYLGHLLEAAVGAPGATGDPASRRVVAELLAALADAGDVARVERVLAVRPGIGSSFEVRAYAAGSVVPRDVVHPADGAAAVLAAGELCRSGDDAIEVVADDGLGLTRSVLSRPAGGELRYRFPDITSYHQANGDEATLEHALASWETPPPAPPPPPPPPPPPVRAAPAVDVEALADAVSSRLPAPVPPPPVAPPVDVEALADAVSSRLPAPMPPPPPDPPPPPAAIDVDALAEAVVARVKEPPSVEQVAFAVRVGLSDGLEGSALAERIARMPTKADLERLVDAILTRLGEVATPEQVALAARDGAVTVTERLRAELRRPQPVVQAQAPPVDMQRVATGIERTWHAASKVEEQSQATAEALDGLAALVLEMETRLAEQVGQWVDALREEVRHVGRLQTAELDNLQHHLRRLADRRPAGDAASSDLGEIKSLLRQLQGSAHDDDGSPGAPVIDLRNPARGRGAG